jgi:hypothetical protein
VADEPQMEPAQVQFGVLVPQGFATHAHDCDPNAGLCTLTGTSFEPHLGKDEQLDHFGPSPSASTPVAPPVD